MGDGAPGPAGTPACTDSISLTRSLSGNEVIIPVIGLKIGVWARQKSSKSEKGPRNVDRRGRDLLQAFPSEQRIKRFEAQVPVPGTRGPPCRSGAFARLKRAPGRGLVRLRFDQRRKRRGPILSRSSLGHHCDLGRVLCALNLECSGALLLQLPRKMPVRCVLGNIAVE